MAGQPRTRSSKVCGARNRRGLPCQSKLLLRGGKCRFHGGMSSGPKTLEGRAAIIASNMRRRGETRKQYVRKPKPSPPAPPPRDDWVSITELLTRSPERVEFWRRAIIAERDLRSAKLSKPELRAVAIEAIRRRNAWPAQQESDAGDE